jgi:hypothetical protein
VNEDDLKSAFLKGAQWAYVVYTEYDSMSGEEEMDAIKAFDRFMKVRAFNLTVGTVFIGSVGWKPDRYSNTYAYSGPIVVGVDPISNTCCLKTTSKSVPIDHDSTVWTIERVIYTPESSDRSE